MENQREADQKFVLPYVIKTILLWTGISMKHTILNHMSERALNMK